MKKTMRNLAVPFALMASMPVALAAAVPVPEADCSVTVRVFEERTLCSYQYNLDGMPGVTLTMKAQFDGADVNLCGEFFGAMESQGGVCKGSSPSSPFGGDIRFRP